MREKVPAMRRQAGRAGATAMGMLVAAFACAAPPARHVPSPDWRDQVVYFVMTDRFDDGDPTNNDQGSGEYRPASRAHYSGGDLAGVTRRLDYIRGLGATAVWITPPVAQQWWNPRVDYGGYHGYWADDFSRVDPHVGTLADYRGLADALHARGMYLVQDVVVNHVADYLHFDAPPPAHDPAAGARLIADARGRTAPTQPPFHLNDPRRARDRAAGIYHWTPPVRDYTDPVQEKTWQMSGLDDLDTENPRVRRALRASYGHWIREVGVDAFRIDTAFYVPAEYFDDFLNADDPQAPGVLRVAAATGRDAFHVFGEGFGIDRAFEDTQARRIESYARDAAGRALLPAMINFPLYGSTLDVFARGRPTAELAHRIESTMRVHARPHLMPTFLDNHDVDRFLSAGSVDALEQGLLMLMTLPGIPTIYYGTEQGFTEPRAAMFAAGYGSGGRDRFDTAAPLYRYLQRATALRREHRLFSRGVPTVLASNAAGAGALVYRMDHDGGSGIVAFNTAAHPVLVDALATGLAAGTRLAGAFAIDGEAADLVTGAHGRVQLVLPPRAGLVWIAQTDAAPGTMASAGTPSQGRNDSAAPAAAAPAATTITLDSPPPGPVRGDLVLTGRADGVRELALVLDGDLSRAVRVPVGRDGRWRATVPTDDLVDAAIAHRVVAFDAASGRVSQPLVFHVEREWRLAADHDDPTGDDHGPAGRYLYPDDVDWRAARPLDLERVQAYASGGALRLDLGMRGLMRAWNPANGFDHVAFTVYIELPGERSGAKVMPLQDATLPAGMRWHRRLRVHGWSNALTGAEGADAMHEGRTLAPGAQLGVDPATNTVSLRLPAAALGHPKTLRGARVYVTTWDYDAGYRTLAAQPAAYVFGGGSAGEPRVMDDALLELR